MIGYASRTGTRRNLAALRERGWRLMISPKGEVRTESMLYALDNGAWWAFRAGKPFDEDAFIAAYGKFGAGADFMVLPDIVAGGMTSLAYSLQWLERLIPLACPAMLAVQDGMTCSDIAPLIGPQLGIFVGGTTEWKLATLLAWGKLARERGASLHVGRVNTRRRIMLCAAAGADSFDGSSASRYVKTLPLLDNARHQPDLFGDR